LRPTTSRLAEHGNITFKEYQAQGGSFKLQSQMRSEAE